MATLFATGAMVDLILAFMTVETVVLVLLHRRTGRGIHPRKLLPTVAAGACLLLALRFALTATAWEWIAVCLFAALVAHLADLAVRRPVVRSE